MTDVGRDGLSLRGEHHRARKARRGGFRSGTAALFCVMAFLLVGVPPADAAGPYIIVTDGESHDGTSYRDAVDALRRFRHAEKVLDLNDTDLDGVFDALRTLSPENVAFVVRPETIEANFVGRVFEGLTKLDDDPLLDCAFGYVTGMTAEDAVNMVLATRAAEEERGAPGKFVAVAHTFAANDLAPFAEENAARYKAYGYETATVNPRDDSPEWRRTADREVRKLSGASMVFLAGHGAGDMSCAIQGAAFGKLRMASPIVVNGTCHSAVTCLRYDSQDRHWTMAETRIDPADSVCLNFIKAGAVGQFASTASSAWSNVAYSVDYFFHRGCTLGEALQRSLNDKIETAGVKEVSIRPFREGERSPQALGDAENPGGLQSFSRVVLIGDPAYRPFPVGPPDPRRTRTDEANPTSPENESEVEALIARMADPNDKTFAALNEVIQLGAAAVPPLINAMETSRDWHIPKALGAIGDKRAVGPLVRKLESAPWSPMREVVAEALGAITGQDFGNDAARWRAWWKSCDKE